MSDIIVPPSLTQIARAEWNSATSEPSMLVGIAGPAGAGKSTIGREIWLHDKFQILSFAHPLKAALIKMTGLDRKWFYNIDYKEKEIPGLPGVTPRIMMQKFGTEFAREMIAPDFWLWRMKMSLSKYSDKNIVIDDIRFENEADLVRVNGGVVIHLQRDFVSPTVHSTHKSEQPMNVHPADFSVKGVTVNETHDEVNQCVRDFYGI